MADHSFAGPTDTCARLIARQMSRRTIFRSASWTFSARVIVLALQFFARRP